MPLRLALALLALSSYIIQPVSGASWANNSPMTTARSSHTATLLSNGKVLVAGGWNGSSSVELYDPATGGWLAASALTTVRWDHTATLLPNGKVLVAGGGLGGGLPRPKSSALG